MTVESPNELTQVESIERKRLVLSLAGLTRRDREWILNRLDASERLRLNAMLRPLLILGSRNLRAVNEEVDRLIEHETNTGSRHDPARESMSQLKLSGASANDLSPIVRQLPVECLDMLKLRLPVGRKHVAGALYSRFKQTPRLGKDHSAGMSVSPAFVDALVRVVEGELRLSEERKISSTFEARLSATSAEASDVCA